MALHLLVSTISNKLKQTQKNIEEEILTSGQERIQVASESLSNLLIAYDYTNMESLAERIVQLQDVQKITISNKSGKVMTTRSRHNSFSGKDVRHFERPILFDGSSIGKVEIWISTERLNNKSKKDRINLVIMLSLFACFLGALIYLTISVVILKPIAHFRDSMIDIVNNPTELTSSRLEINCPKGRYFR